MEYSDSYLREYLPREYPSAEYVPEDVADEIRSWIETSWSDDPGLIARSTRWTYAMFQELRLHQVQIEVGLTLSAKGELLFIAEAGAEASIKFRLARKSPGP